MDLLTGDARTPLGNYVRMKHYVDANLLNYKRTGCSVTAICNLVNKSPVYLYYKE